MKFRSNKQLEVDSSFLSQKLNEINKETSNRTVVVAAKADLEEEFKKNLENTTVPVRNKNNSEVPNHTTNTPLYSAKMITKTNNNSCVSGLNNLGNTCFFNSVLQVKYLLPFVFISLSLSLSVFELNLLNKKK